MFCGKCGKKINDRDEFCTNCGTRVQSIVIDNEDEEILCTSQRESLVSQIKKAKCLPKYNNDTCINDMDTVKFGLYPQTDISGKNREPIEWIVLENDEINQRSLLMTKYILDCKSLYDSLGRGWLNNEFCNSAFNKTEKNLILNFDCQLRSFDYVFDDFTSKVFLLNEEEFIKYFGENVRPYNKKAATRGIAYSKREKQLQSNYSCENGYEWRIGNSSYLLEPKDYYVNYDGNLIRFSYLDDIHFNYYELGIIPSIWVDYN